MKALVKAKSEIQPVKAKLDLSERRMEMSGGHSVNMEPGPAPATAPRHRHVHMQETAGNGHGHHHTGGNGHHTGGNGHHAGEGGGGRGAGVEADPRVKAQVELAMKGITEMGRRRGHVIGAAASGAGEQNTVTGNSTDFCSEHFYGDHLNKFHFKIKIDDDGLVNIVRVARNTE